MAGQPDENHDRVERIIQQILGSDRMRESSAFSQRSYSDEPILRTGADLQRERAQQRAADRRAAASAHSRSEFERKRRAREAAYRQQGEDEQRDVAAWRNAVAQRGASATQGSPARQDQSAQRSQGAQRVATSTWNWLQDRLRAKENVIPVKLPETLRQLRALEQSNDADGHPLRGIRLFLQQARLAADFQDNQPLVGTPRYRYLPTYQELSDRELRGYFTWRTSWRAGTAYELPYTYAHLLASELVNNIGPGDELAHFDELRRMRQRCEELGTQDLGANLLLDLNRWVRDFVIYYGLDPKLATTEDERAYAQAVAALRTAERAVLCQESLRGLTPADSPQALPTDAQLWAAMGAVSTYPLDRSPFFREHPDEAAAVGAAVFRKLASHCGKRRKVNYVDGLLGPEESYQYTPFLGAPFVEDKDHGQVTVRLTACETVSFRFGRWNIKRGYERAARNRELGKLLRAIDQQMRADWQYNRPLKERELPKYLRTMIAKESAAVHERQVEAEKRKITIDLSQLKQIRTAAAATREALLIDEEREGYVPGMEQATQPQPGEQPQLPGMETSYVRKKPQAKASLAQAVPAVPAAAAVTSQPAPPSHNPCGLTDLELQVARRIVASEPYQDLLGPGKPLESVLVDSINEKLFDEIGDAVIEFGDDGPTLIEDYADDVREILGS